MTQSNHYEAVEAGWMTKVRWVYETSLGLVSSMSDRAKKVQLHDARTSAEVDANYVARGSRPLVRGLLRWCVIVCT